MSHQHQPDRRRGLLHIHHRQPRLRRPARCRNEEFAVGGGAFPGGSRANARCAPTFPSGSEGGARRRVTNTSDLCLWQRPGSPRSPGGRSLDANTCFCINIPELTGCFSSDGKCNFHVAFPRYLPFPGCPTGATVKAISADIFHTYVFSAALCHRGGWKTRRHSERSERSDCNMN